jgi:class 3 adenylate cyclase
MSVEVDRELARIEAGAALDEVVGELDRAGWAVEFVDADWTLRWISQGLRTLIGEFDDERLGIGLHVFEALQLPTWDAAVTKESGLHFMAVNVPYMAYEHPEGLDGILAMSDGRPEAAALVELVPAPPPPVWVSNFDFLQGDLPPTSIRYSATRHYTPAGDLLGTSFVFSPDLPAATLSLVARGDPAMFGRMARLLEPAPRPAAVLFADLRASAVLSRRLPSAAYFRLVRAITTAIDEVVAARRGIVGKHAGDGVTAFFLSEDLGSDSGAARAALDAARAVSEAVGEAAAELASAGAPLRPEECVMGVGVHWGGALYIGQVVTGGRLEVTALGDEMNECARIEQSSSDGEVLASKGLVERLSAADADALGLDGERLRYRTVAELPEAGEKAIRDAGGVAVAEVGASR